MGRRLVVLFLLVAGVYACAPVASAHAARGCSLQPTDGTTTRVLGSRSYELHVPAGLKGRVPLLITMHATAQLGRVHESETGWSPFADAEGFIVAYPNGLAGSWNIREDSYDVAFLRGVAADIASRWCVDRTRVYASGYSLGARMAQRLACDAEDVFASVTEYGGGSPNALGGSCRLSRGVSVGLFHGEADFVVPPADARRARDEWIARNRCPPTPIEESVSEGVLQRWSGCADGAEVLWRTYPGQSHAWPQGDRANDMRSRMWSFLATHPRTRPAPPLPPQNRGCTIRGTAGNDILRATPGDDVVCAGAGNDIVYGGGGNDTVYGGRGNDILRGQGGNDRLLGGPGRDILRGGAGRDYLNTRDNVRGNDIASGGRGSDTCDIDRGDLRTSC